MKTATKTKNFPDMKPETVIEHEVEGIELAWASPLNYLPDEHPYRGVANFPVNPNCFEPVD